MWSSVLARMRWSLGVTVQPDSLEDPLSPPGRTASGGPEGRLGQLPLLVGHLQSASSSPIKMSS